MDGNGRWAEQWGWPRVKGHKVGVQAAHDVLEASADLGIKHLTLYAFSTENWKRPSFEVTMLMALLRMHLRIFLPKLQAKCIRFHHVGAKEGLPLGICKDLISLEEKTKHHSGMVFHLAVNYGSRLELVQAARRCVEDGLDSNNITEEAIAQRLWTADIPDVDLLIRTSGASRISNFMLWQAAYAELYLTECFWPDFRAPQLMTAVEAYSQRERRFGCL
jgi:undecaprenyl diphosphate synthase